MNWIVIAGLAAAELLLGRWLRGALYTLPALWAWPALDLDWAVTFAMQAAGFIVFASFLEEAVLTPLTGRYLHDPSNVGTASVVLRRILVPAFRGDVIGNLIPLLLPALYMLLPPAGTNTSSRVTAPVDAGATAAICDAAANATSAGAEGVCGSAGDYTSPPSAAPAFVLPVGQRLLATSFVLTACLPLLLVRAGLFRPMPVARMVISAATMFVTGAGLVAVGLMRETAGDAAFLPAFLHSALLFPAACFAVGVGGLAVAQAASAAAAARNPSTLLLGTWLPGTINGATRALAALQHVVEAKLSGTGSGSDKGKAPRAAGAAAGGAARREHQRASLDAAAHDDASTATSAAAKVATAAGADDDVTASLHASLHPVRLVGWLGLFVQYTLRTLAALLLTSWAQAAATGIARGILSCEASGCVVLGRIGWSLPVGLYQWSLYGLTPLLAVAVIVLVAGVTALAASKQVHDARRLAPLQTLAWADARIVRLGPSPVWSDRGYIRFMERGKDLPVGGNQQPAAGAAASQQSQGGSEAAAAAAEAADAFTRATAPLELIQALWATPVATFVKPLIRHIHDRALGSPVSPLAWTQVMTTLLGSRLGVLSSVYEEAGVRKLSVAKLSESIHREAPLCRQSITLEIPIASGLTPEAAAAAAAAAVRALPSTIRLCVGDRQLQARCERDVAKATQLGGLLSLFSTSAGAGNNGSGAAVGGSQETGPLQALAAALRGLVSGLGDVQAAVSAASAACPAIDIQLASQSIPTATQVLPTTPGTVTVDVNVVVYWQAVFPLLQALDSAINDVFAPLCENANTRAALVAAPDDDTDIMDAGRLLQRRWAEHVAELVSVTPIRKRGVLLDGAETRVLLVPAVRSAAEAGFEGDAASSGSGGNAVARHVAGFCSALRGTLDVPLFSLRFHLAEYLQTRSSNASFFDYYNEAAAATASSAAQASWLRGVRDIFLPLAPLASAEVVTDLCSPALSLTVGERHAAVAAAWDVVQQSPAPPFVLPDISLTALADHPPLATPEGRSLVGKFTDVHRVLVAISSTAAAVAASGDDSHAVLPWVTAASCLLDAACSLLDVRSMLLRNQQLAAASKLQLDQPALVTISRLWHLYARTTLAGVARLLTTSATCTASRAPLPSATDSLILPHDLARLMAEQQVSSVARAAARAAPDAILQQLTFPIGLAFGRSVLLLLLHTLADPAPSASAKGLPSKLVQQATPPALLEDLDVRGAAVRDAARPAQLPWATPAAAVPHERAVNQFSFATTTAAASGASPGLLDEGCVCPVLPIWVPAPSPWTPPAPAFRGAPDAADGPAMRPVSAAGTSWMVYAEPEQPAPAAGAASAGAASAATAPAAGTAPASGLPPAFVRRLRWLRAIISALDSAPWKPLLATDAGKVRVAAELAAAIFPAGASATGAARAATASATAAVASAVTPLLAGVPTAESLAATADEDRALFGKELGRGVATRQVGVLVGQAADLDKPAEAAIAQAELTAARTAARQALAAAPGADAAAIAALPDDDEATLMPAVIDAYIANNFNKSVKAGALALINVLMTVIEKRDESFMYGKYLKPALPRSVATPKPPAAATGSGDAAVVYPAPLPALAAIERTPSAPPPDPVPIMTATEDEPMLPDDDSHAAAVPAVAAAVPSAPPATWDPLILPEEFMQKLAREGKLAPALPSHGAVPNPAGAAVAAAHAAHAATDSYKARREVLVAFAERYRPVIVGKVADILQQTDAGASLSILHDATTPLSSVCAASVSGSKATEGQQPLYAVTTGRLFPVPVPGWERSSALGAVTATPAIGDDARISNFLRAFFVHMTELRSLIVDAHQQLAADHATSVVAPARRLAEEQAAAQAAARAEAERALQDVVSNDGTAPAPPVPTIAAAPVPVQSPPLLAAASSASASSLPTADPSRLLQSLLCVPLNYTVADVTACPPTKYAAALDVLRSAVGYMAIGTRAGAAGKPAAPAPLFASPAAVAAGAAASGAPLFDEELVAPLRWDERLDYVGSSYSPADRRDALKLQLVVMAAARLSRFARAYDALKDLVLQTFPPRRVSGQQTPLPAAGTAYNLVQMLLALDEQYLLPAWKVARLPESAGAATLASPHFDRCLSTALAIVASPEPDRPFLLPVHDVAAFLFVKRAQAMWALQHALQRPLDAACDLVLEEHRLALDAPACLPLAGVPLRLGAELDLARHQLRSIAPLKEYVARSMVYASGVAESLRSAATAVRAPDVPAIYGAIVRTHYKTSMHGLQAQESGVAADTLRRHVDSAGAATVAAEQLVHLSTSACSVCADTEMKAGDALAGVVKATHGDMWLAVAAAGSLAPAVIQ